MEFEVVLEVGVAEVALRGKGLLEGGSLGRTLSSMAGITSSSTSTTAS